MISPEEIGRSPKNGWYHPYCCCHQGIYFISQNSASGTFVFESFWCRPSLSILQLPPYLLRWGISAFLCGNQWENWKILTCWISISNNWKIGNQLENWYSTISEFFLCWILTSISDGYPSFVFIQLRLQISISFGCTYNLYIHGISDFGCATRAIFV